MPCSRPCRRGPRRCWRSRSAAQARWAGVDWGVERAARVVEPVKGREVYEAVTRRRVDPALAEWAGSGTYSARIYPLAPGACKRVVFAYDQTLPPSGGRVVLPLPEPAPGARLRRITVHEVGGQLLRPTVADGRQPLAPEQAGGQRVWRPALERSGRRPGLRSGAARAGLSVLAGADAAIPGTLATCSLCPSCRRGLSLTPRGALSSCWTPALRAARRSTASRARCCVASSSPTTRSASSPCSPLTCAPRCSLPASCEQPRGAGEPPRRRRAPVRLEGATSFASVVDALKGQPDLLRAGTFFLLCDGEITWGADDPAADRGRRPGRGEALGLLRLWHDAPQRAALRGARAGGRADRARRPGPGPGRGRAGPSPAGEPPRVGALDLAGRADRGRQPGAALSGAGPGDRPAHLAPHRRGAPAGAHRRPRHRSQGAPRPQRPHRPAGRAGLGRDLRQRPARRSRRGVRAGGLCAVAPLRPCRTSALRS